MTTLPIILKGQEFAVSSFSAPIGLSIAGLANGDTAVAWQDGANAAVQLFNANGAAASYEFVPFHVSGETLTNENVVALANGNFVLTFNDTIVSGGNTYVTVYAQILDPNLNPVGLITVIPQFQQITGFYSGADVFATPDGGFAYAESINQSETVQAFHADGSKNGASHQTGPLFPFLFGATALTNGDYATLTGNADGFWVYDKSGTQIVGLTFIAGGNAQLGDISALPDGRFVIVYENIVTEAVDAQIFNPDGSTFGNEIAVNNGAANPGFGYPHVSTMPDGRFVVSWYDTSGDAGNNLTEARVFNPNGTPATAVFAIPGSQEGSGNANDVTALSDTSFSVDWNTNATIEGQVLSVQAPPFVADNFTGYGTSDVLIQDGATVLDSLINNGVAVGAGNIGTLPSGWSVIGTGDFNGDGTTDLLLQDGSTVGDWFIHNGAFAGGATIAALPPGVNVIGTGDFNGDGTTDLLLQAGSTLVDWTIHNGTLAGGATIATLPPGWSVIGTGDFNGDGTTDLLLQAGRTVGDWFIHNGTFAGGTTIATLPAGWSATGSGISDFMINGNSGGAFNLGLGNQTVTFEAASIGSNTINNFNPAIDVVSFNHALFANYAALMGATTQVGPNTVITADAADTVTLTNTTATMLSPSNFMFA